MSTGNESDIFVVMGFAPVEDNQTMNQPEQIKKPGRPPKQGDPKKTRSVYCTESAHAVVCQLLKLPDDRIAYVKGWMDRGAIIGGGK